MTRRVVIVGASGYSGAVLAELLLGHPGARIVGVFGSGAREGEAPLAGVHPRFRGLLELPVRAASREAIAACEPDAVFLCTPHEASVHLAAELIRTGTTVLDLSAGFRLADAAQYPAHYKFEHPHPALLARAVYGLPERYRERLAGADLIAVPGCYPTASVLALAPIAPGVARRADGRATRPIIDATSGVSGAGRSAQVRSLFCEVHQQAYAVMSHRHQPEIDAYAGVATVFTAHLGPYERGILATIHVELAPGWDSGRVGEAYRAAYEHEPFVRLCPAGVWPSVADVRGTNFCDLAWAVDEREGHLIVVSAIDNLVKGAAGQAVQCFNIRMGLPETLGLRPGA